MVRIVEVPAIGVEVMEVKPKTPEWALDIIKYVDANELLDNRWEARKIRNRISRYTLLDGVLYKRGYFTPLLRCISFKEA